jgi:hypothetical protein
MTRVLKLKMKRTTIQMSLYKPTQEVMVQLIYLEIKMVHHLIVQGKSQTTQNPKQVKIRTRNLGADPK